MIICYFYVEGVTIDEAEAYSPLIVDGDRILTFPVSLQVKETSNLKSHHFAM